jgi:EpsI family protein
MTTSSAVDTGHTRGLPAGRDFVHLLLAGLLMLACLGLSVWMKPTKLWSDRVGEPDLENIVPKSFGDWVLSPYGAIAVVNPQQEAALRDIYTSTIARAYIHKPTGRQIMLSLAYGKDQSRDTQLHPPEACYRSQGFRVDRLQPENISVGNLTLPAMRMDTVLGARQEYVTYWVRVGDGLSRGSLDRNLVRMRFAAKGYIADGLLFRVSEVTRAKSSDSYALQDEFMRALLGNVSKAGMDGLVGLGNL